MSGTFSKLIEPILVVTSFYCVGRHGRESLPPVPVEKMALDDQIWVRRSCQISEAAYYHCSKSAAGMDRDGLSDHKQGSYPAGIIFKIGRKRRKMISFKSIHRLSAAMQCRPATIPQISWRRRLQRIIQKKLSNIGWR